MVMADGELVGVLAGLAIVSVPLMVAGVLFTLAGSAAARAPRHR
jgi:hypothetical protein